MAKLKYFHLKGKATIAQLGEFTMVFIHDEEVNPEKQILKFSAPLVGFADNSSINPVAGNVTKVDDINMIAGFNRVWLDHTIDNGFRLKKDDGSLITSFTDLKVPEPATAAKMNPVMP